MLIPEQLKVLDHQGYHLLKEFTKRSIHNIASMMGHTFLRMLLLH